MAAYGNRAVVLQSIISNADLVDFLDNDQSVNARTLYVGNVDAKVTRKLLYELMVQVGPVESIRIVAPREGCPRTIAFVVFELAASVRYAMLVLNNVSLFRSKLSLNYSGGHKDKPKTVFPPYGPTFFDLPPGFEDVADSVKATMYQAFVISPPHYKTGYFIQPSNQQDEEEPPNHFEENGHYSAGAHRSRRDEDGMPLHKQQRVDSGGVYSYSPQEMRNVYHQHAQMPEPVRHPFGQYPPQPDMNQSHGGFDQCSSHYQYQQPQQSQQQQQQFYYPQDTPPTASYPDYRYSPQSPQPSFRSPQASSHWPPQSHPPSAQRSFSANQADHVYQYQARPQNSSYYYDQRR